MSVTDFLTYLSTRAIVDTAKLTCFGGRNDTLDQDGNIVSTAYDFLSDWYVPVVMMEQKGLWSSPTKFQFSVVDYGGANETVNPKTEIVLPIGDTLVAVQYLETQKASGTWNAYELDNPPRSDLGFLIIKAWVPNGDGTETVKRFRVFYDLQGNAGHAEIV